jgi:hypothetical protein
MEGLLLVHIPPAFGVKLAVAPVQMDGGPDNTGLTGMPWMIPEAETPEEQKSALTTEKV